MQLKIMLTTAMLIGKCGAFLRQNYRPLNHKFSHRLLASTSKIQTSRPSSEGKSLDVKLVYEEPLLVRAHLEARSVSSEIINKILPEINNLFKKRIELIKIRDDAKHSRNVLSKSIGQLIHNKGSKEEVEELKKEVERVSLKANATDLKLGEVDEATKNRFSSLPNLLDDRVPYGKGDDDNVLVYEWGEEYKLIGNDYKWHDELAIGLNGFWSEEASRLSGSRFSVLAGSVAQLERAISMFFLDTHVNEHGYTETSVPIIVSRSILQGTGQLPKFEDDLFKVNHSVHGEDGFLIPTAEVPLTSLWSNTIIEDHQTLPRSLVSLTPCFRAEAGSHGKDVKGLLRLHQFNKVELVKITTPETSSVEHEALVNHAEAILKLLKLPYRKMKLCSGDIGFSAKMCYDLEVWLPSTQSYREISSCSNCGDFQAKRMGLRYRQPLKTTTIDNDASREEDNDASRDQGNGGADDDESKKLKKETALKKKKKKKTPSRGAVQYCHTINGSGLAVGRALVAVLETYQQPDGSIQVPDVLIPYMGGRKIIHPDGGAPHTSDIQKKSII
mmetsp:Transcript_52440/g.67254  ORF Transcript_52440/g.67254 Transcript_52440/m.67254 type:complete len:557 (-) Transcript_52440:33-1703(-)